MQNNSLQNERDGIKMNRMETSKESERKRPGPVPGPITKKYNVLIEEELAEWGKQQLGGLSELIRRLLSAERRRQEKSIREGG